MTLFQKGFTKISGIAVLITLGLEIGALHIFHDPSPLIFKNEVFNSVLIYIKHVVLGIGFYASVYSLLLWVFENKLWILFYKQLNINGVWYHVLSSASEANYQRYGRMDICQKFSDVKITGTNYNSRFDRDDISTWRSDSIECHADGVFDLNYSVSRSGTREPSEKRGNMRFKIETNQRGTPIRLVGNFQDAHPSNIRGTIIAVRDSDWKARIPSVDLIAVIGQPAAAAATASAEAAPGTNS